jgi:hypothetical protein
LVVPDLRSVPDDAKWRIAAQYNAYMTAMYESVFRPVLQKRYDELEQEIWIKMAQFSHEIALSIRSPVKTARELAESIRLVNTILFGPDFKEEILETGKNGAVIIIRRCPHLMNDSSQSSGDKRTFHRCMAFNLATQKKLNPEYSSRFVRSMCLGDRQCEIKIEPEKDWGKKTS